MDDKQFKELKDYIHARYIAIIVIIIALNILFNLILKQIELWIT